MARHLPAPSAMLRLKGEHDDSMADGADETPPGEFEETFQDHPVFDSGSLPDGDDFQEGLEDDDAREGRWSILSDTRGLAIAAAAFVPTFLIAFFGVPYLLGEPPLARTPNKSSTTAYTRDPQSESGWSLSNSLSEALRGGPLDRPVVVPPSAPPANTPVPPPVGATPPTPAAPPAAAPTPTAPPAAPAPPAASTPADPSPPASAEAPAAKSEAPPVKSPAPAAPARGSETTAALGDQSRTRDQTGEPMPGTPGSSASRSSSGSDSGSAPSPPPAPSRAPEPERKATASKSGLEPRSAPEPRQGAATPGPPRSQAESRKGSGDWTPAAAFADRDAAARLD